MSGHAAVGGYNLSWASRTDVGKVRRVNEDSLLANPGLFVVADGMGGHAAGDVASRLAIEVFEQMTTYPTILPIARLTDVLNAANSAVVEQAQAAQYGGMGTTLVGAAVVDNGGDAAVVIFHVGDSRCYVLEDGELRQATSDHSQVQEMIDSGDITQAQASTHPLRNVVTRAVGIEPHVLADYLVLADTHRRRLMLCSDGVSGEVDVETMHQLLADPSSVDEAADGLIELVLSGRASDNASLIVVDIERAVIGGDESDVDVTSPRRHRPSDRFEKRGNS